MFFKDRLEAGEKLAKLLQSERRRFPPEADRPLGEIYGKSRPVVVSLLRGGIIIGDVLVKKLWTKGPSTFGGKLDHLPLPVAKIPASGNPELAIGALCFSETYLDKDIVNMLSLTSPAIGKQIKIAQEKFQSYLNRFGLNKDLYKQLKNKIAILVDDGVATGSTVRAGLLFIKSQKPKAVWLAVPVAPIDFDSAGFDKVFILSREPGLGSVSQFYENFPQVEDEEVRKILIIESRK